MGVWETTLGIENIRVKWNKLKKIFPDRLETAQCHIWSVVLITVSASRMWIFLCHITCSPSIVECTRTVEFLILVSQVVCEELWQR